MTDQPRIAGLDYDDQGRVLIPRKLAENFDREHRGKPYSAVFVRMGKIRIVDDLPGGV